MSDNNLDDQLRELIADVLEIEPEEITDTSLFAEEHGADSLRAIEILARIEKTFDVEIPQDELSLFFNLESVLAIVQAHAKA